jgi:thiamine biosynthesis protein ThiS
MDSLLQRADLNFEVLSQQDPMNEQQRIEIIVNDVPIEVEAESRLDHLIKHFGEMDPDLIVELNGKFVYPKAYAGIVVNQGDRLEFINPNFGG